MMKKKKIVDFWTLSNPRNEEKTSSNGGGLMTRSQLARPNVHTAHLPQISVEPPAPSTPPMPSSPKARVSRLMLQEGRVGSDVKLSGAQEGYRCPDMRCNKIHYDKKEKGSSSLLVRLMAREPSPDVVRRKKVESLLMRPSKSAKKLPSSNSSSNSTLAEGNRSPKLLAKSSADLRIPSPAESSEAKLSKLGISPPKSPAIKKVGFAPSKSTDESGQPEGSDMSAKGSKWARGARRASVDLATALMIPSLNIGKIKSNKNFLSVPEEGDGESDGASDGEGGRRSRRGSTDSRGTPNRLPTFSRKLLDAGKRMGRRASTMIDQGLLLKSDKLAHLEKLAAKSSTFSDDAPKIPESAIYEPPAVAPVRQRGRALTIANTAAAKESMKMLSTKEKVPTVFKFTAGIGGDDGEDKNKKSLKKKWGRSSSESDDFKVFVAGTMTNWESREMVRTEDGYVIVLECPEGDVYYKFFVSDSGGGADGKHWKGDWVVDRNQEVVSNRDFWNPVDANIIRISRDDNDVFAALTVDSFCVRRSGEHEEENREKNEDLWCQEVPDFEGRHRELKENCKNPPILPPQLLNVLLNKEEVDSRRIRSRDDRMHLPNPNSHVVVNHLYAQSIRDELLVMASTSRYKKKSVTVVFYKSLSGS